MGMLNRWRREAGPRVQGSRDLDRSKVQAPCIVQNPAGGFRLYYTAVGPAKPYSACQGYILSAVSEDGIVFRTEPGIRVAPQPALPHASLRALAPSVTRCRDGRWRMYYEARGPADRPKVICSAISADMLHWDFEEGIRLQNAGGVRAPRFCSLPDGRERLYCIATEYGAGGPAGGKRLSEGVASAVTSDGLHFEFEPGYWLQPNETAYESAGFSAAEVIPPATVGDRWTMFFSAWQDVPAGTVVPVHPSQDIHAVASGRSDDFAAASIASDMSGYRSRIFVANSADGLEWERGECVIAGGGYDADGVDAVHAEDMSLIRLGDGRYRMVYAACDRAGNWTVASAVTVDG